MLSRQNDLKNWLLLKITTLKRFGESCLFLLKHFKQLIQKKHFFVLRWAFDSKGLITSDNLKSSLNLHALQPSLIRNRKGLPKKSM